MKPAEQINSPYELICTTAEVRLDSRTVQVPFTAILELSPRPQLILDCEFASSDAAATNELQSKGEISVRLDTGRTIDTVIGNRWHLGGGKMRNILIPKSEPVTVRDDHAMLAMCKFSLINFPSIWGNKDICRYPDTSNSASNIVCQRFQLEANPWFIEITAIESLMAVHHQLTRRGGSAITHYGSVTRVDKSEFSQNDLISLLETLHLFLSFARGSYCGLTLLSGHNSNVDIVWEQWGTYKVEPWRRELLTWMDESSSHSLSSVFEGLRKLLNDPTQSDTISQVIYWYLRSNESIEPEVGIVLNQAALERLSFYRVGPRCNKKEGVWIAQALQLMGIDTDLPTHCQELRRLQKLHNWSHGPHAIVEIRNDLVHSDTKRGPFSETALREAQNLGLHYIELMLLGLAGYKGRYRNRLKSRARYSSPVENVPWAPAGTP